LIKNDGATAAIIIEVTFIDKNPNIVNIKGETPNIGITKLA
jgi:hypothetical protein